MNLQESIQLQSLAVKVKDAKPKTKTRVQVAKRVFDIAAQAGHPYKGQTAEDWAKRFLCSEEFTLMEVDINAAASVNKLRGPDRVAHYMQCSNDAIDPIVIDYNHRHKGKTASGYYPRIVVQDGTHRKLSRVQLGHTKILAWVGCRAIRRMEKEGKKLGKVIQASDYKQFERQMDNPGWRDKVKELELTNRVSLDDIKATAVRMGMKLAKHVKQLDAGGPGSGRHPGAGSFKRINNDHFAFKNNTDSWKAKDGTLVHMQDSGDKTIVKEGAKDQAPKVVHKGDSDTASEFVQKRYGINDTMAACGARSSGQLEDPDPSDTKVPVDASDAGPRVESSDRLKWNPDKPQLNAPGTKGWSSEDRGKNNPIAIAPGTGVGPRLKPNTGASRSDMSRIMNAGGPGSGRHAGDSRTVGQKSEDENNSVRRSMGLQDTYGSAREIDDTRKRLGLKSKALKMKGKKIKKIVTNKKLHRDH